MDPEIFALSGGIIGGLAGLPQLGKIYNTDNVESFCPRAVTLKLVSALFMVYYAWSKSLPVIFTVTLLGILFDLYVLVKIKKSQKVS